MKDIACLGIAAVLWMLYVASAPAWGQGSPGVEGTWRGVILYAPAELEVEIAVRLSKDAQGGLAGSIDIPTKPIDGEPLSDIFFDGTRISWELRRQTGSFLFDGALSADGKQISGRYFERGEVYDFSLERSDPAAPPPVTPSIHPLSTTGAELRERFNADAGKVRLVMLLSPG